eukprot:ANDGO_00068.mRNA.1 hypothetical protein
MILSLPYAEVVRILSFFTLKEALMSVAFACKAVCTICLDELFLMLVMNHVCEDERAVLSRLFPYDAAADLVLHLVSLRQARIFHVLVIGAKSSGRHSFVRGLYGSQFVHDHDDSLSVVELSTAVIHVHFAELLDSTLETFESQCPFEIVFFIHSPVLRQSAGFMDVRMFLSFFNRFICQAFSSVPWTVVVFTHGCSSLPPGIDFSNMVSMKADTIRRFFSPEVHPEFQGLLIAVTDCSCSVLPDGSVWSQVVPRALLTVSVGHESHRDMLLFSMLLHVYSAPSAGVLPDFSIATRSWMKAEK